MLKNEIADKIKYQTLSLQRKGDWLTENSKQSKNIINSLKNSTYNENQLQADRCSVIGEISKDSRLIEKCSGYGDDEKDTCEGSDTDSITEIKTRNIVHSQIIKYELSSNNRYAELRKDSFQLNDMDNNYLDNVSQRRTEYIAKDISDGGLHSKPCEKRDRQLTDTEQQQRLAQNSNFISGNKNVLKLLSNKHLANLNIKVDRIQDIRINKISENKWKETMGSFRASKLGVRTSFRSSKKRRRNIYNTREEFKREFQGDEKGVKDSYTKENYNHRTQLFHGVNRIMERVKCSDVSTIDSNPQIIPNASSHLQNDRDLNEAVLNVDKSQSRSMSCSPIERAPIVKKNHSSESKLKEDSLKIELGILLNKSDNVREKELTIKTNIKSDYRNLKDDIPIQAQTGKLLRKNSRCSRKSEYQVNVRMRPNSVADLRNKFNSINLQNESSSISKPTSFGTVYVGKCITLPKLYISPRASFKRKYRHKTSKCLKRQGITTGHNIIETDDTVKEGNFSSMSRKSVSNSLTELNMKDLFEEGDYNKTDEEKVCEKIKTALSSGMFKGETEESEDERQKSVERETSNCSELDTTKEDSQSLSKSVVDIIEEVSSKEEENFEYHKRISECVNSPTNLKIYHKNEHSIYLPEQNNVTQYYPLNTDKIELSRNESYFSEELSNDFTSIDTTKSGDSGIHSISVISTESELSNRKASIGSKDTALHTDAYNKSEEQKSEADIFKQAGVHHKLPSSSSECKKFDKSDGKIYAGILSAVKNTMKKKKENDSIRSVQQKKSSKDKKWFKRSKSKEFKGLDILPTNSGKMQVSTECKETSNINLETNECQHNVSGIFINEQTLPVSSHFVSQLVDNTKQSKAIKKTTGTFYGRFLFGSKSKDKSSKSLETSPKEIYDCSAVDKILEKDPTEKSFRYLHPMSPILSQNKLTYSAQEDKVLLEQVKSVPTTVDNETQFSILNQMPVKTIPPPPKTPIPSPPTNFKKLHLINTCIGSGINSKAHKKNIAISTNSIEEITEHKLSPKDVDMYPNSSFLWSKNAYSLDILKKCNSQRIDANTYDQLSKLDYFQEKSEDSCVPNYTEIANLSADEEEVMSHYDVFGVTDIPSYDEIKSSSSCGYDEICPPLTNDINHPNPVMEGYDPVNPPTAQQYDYVGIVSAKLAVVNENQIDSLCYEYDDIASYNVSLMSHSYEPVCPPQEPNKIPPPAVACKTFMDAQQTTETFEPQLAESEEESGQIHEVFSYEITTLARSDDVNPNIDGRINDQSKRKKKRNTAIPKYSIKAMVKNPYSDWTDVTDREPLSFQVPLELLQNRRNKRTKGRVAWTQGVRRYVRSHPSESVKSGNKFGLKGLHTKSRTMESPAADSDNDEETVDHYEAIYEVINPAEGGDTEADDSLNIYLPDDQLNDSFDSDDSSEAYSRLQPLSSHSILSDSRCFLDSRYCENKDIEKKCSRNSLTQQNNINKFAEAANSGMMKLRKNWSHTKNEVRSGLSKIKKKSTFSAPDVTTIENIYEETSPAVSDKSKWSFKSHFRRKLSTSSSQSDISKESKSLWTSPKKSPTFYLTLTIAPDSQQKSDKLMQTYEELHNHRKISAPSLTSSTLNHNSSPTDFVLKSKSTSSVPKRTVSARSILGAPSRPTIAPPDPPAEKDEQEEEEDSQEISKDKLAMKLNQILSSGPTMPPGRRVLRTSDYPSLEYSSPSLDHIHSTKDFIKYATINPSRHSLPIEVSNTIQFNLARTRGSVISSSSNGSNEGYIRPCDIATSPPPLPARPLSGAGSFKRLSEAKLTTVDSNSYLDLNYNLPPQAIYTSSHFQHEPLYQFYTAKVERAALFQGDCSSEDDYEVINDGNLKQELKLMRPTAMELVTPADGRRTLWCELPEVMSSGILNKISGQERKIQEAMFEVMTSEASYMKSLDVLVSHFKNCPEFNAEDDTQVITRREAKVLFSDILPVMKFSELFLADLESRWQESVKISGITDIVLKHAKSFSVYVKYCSNQIYQDRMLRNLKEHNSRFMEVVNRLESSSVCQSLAMHSFLMLPMQRITRLPLLLDAIFNRLEYGSPHWEQCKAALATITKVVAECNEGARKMERLEEMLILSRQLDFREVKAIPLLSSSRWLVKKGELTRLTWRESDAKLTFGRKISKHTLYFFLFSDILVVTKRKSDDQHLVLDYCPRNMVQVLELENANRFPGRILDGYKNLLIMTMLQNHENRTIEMVLSCPLESDRTRWIEAVTPRISDNPDEQVYEEWDCPQVQATHSYLAAQSDEISLEISDVINVLKKTSDGWYQGERLRDGEKGWFPGNHTTEIASAHVRARNLRQRYRLLVISGSFIEKEKKEREEKSERKKERRKTVTLKESL